MSNNLPQNFNFEDYNIRVVLIDEKPWWVAKDVCDVLGYSNSRKTIQDNCKEHGVTTSYILSNGGTQNYTMINESNLYRLIMKSKKPNAEKFQDWIVEEVIPTIMRKGSYSLKQDSYQIEDPIERAKRWIQEEEVRQQLLLENKEKSKTIEKQEEEIDFLEKEVEENKEKAECAERFLDFEIIGFDMNEAAQNLSLKLGGRNKLMEKLREDKILMKETKEVYYENGVKIIHIKNIPYWHFVKAGYFVTKTSRTERENVVNIYTKTRVTTKGLEFLRRKYN